MSQYEREKALVVAAARRLAAKGFLPATGGNLSVRLDGGRMAVTPSGMDYAVMESVDVCVLDANLAVVEGERKPSIESSLHAAVYAARPDVGAVVHTHQTYASALAALRKPVPALFDEQVRHLGRRIPLVPYAPSGTGFLRNAVARAVRDGNNAYILGSHGALCLGIDMVRAEHNAEILEKVAVAYLVALCAEGKARKIPLLVREIAFAKLKADEAKAAKGGNA